MNVKEKKSAELAAKKSAENSTPVKLTNPEKNVLKELGEKVFYSTEKFGGMTVQEMSRVLPAALIPVAKKRELETGKEVYFNKIHFFKKYLIIRLIINGNNKLKKSTEIITPHLEKTVNPSLKGNAEALALRRQKDAEIKAAADLSYLKELASLVVSEKGKGLNFDKVPAKLRNEAIKAIESNPEVRAAVTVKKTATKTRSAKKILADK